MTINKIIDDDHENKIIIDDNKIIIDDHKIK
jgi:hypothetical protein